MKLFPIHFRPEIGLAALLLLSAGRAFASPPVIDDQKIMRDLQASMEETVGKNGNPSADELSVMANKADLQKPGIPLPTPPQTVANTSYEALSESVFLIGSIFKCGKCDKWHAGSGATAWCIGEDGLMVTNAHVFKNAKGGAMAVSDRKGNCHPVTGIIGIDVASDVAVFRVKAKGLQPLRMGTAADVGDPVTVISNPAGNYFLRTSGSVARYSTAPMDKDLPNVTWMAVTADYAKGSSGGPVFNDAGEVVGMVASTRSIYTEDNHNPSQQPPKGQLQMVIKNCVPVDAIRSLFAAEATTKS